MKDILVHVNEHEAWSNHIDLAIALARRFGARLTGILPHEQLALVKLMADGPGGGAEFIPELQARADRAAAALGARFADTLRAGTVEGDLVTAEGRAHQVLTLAGRFHDLIVVEQTNLHEDDINWSSAEEAAVLSGRPTLVAPREVISDGAFRRILVAWNGGREATRALHAARPFLADAEEVLVLEGPSREMAASVTRAPPGDVMDWLRRHTRAVRRVASDIADRDAADAILQMASTHRCDLVVMGAYGRRGLARLVLGGATSKVLRAARLPVLAAH